MPFYDYLCEKGHETTVEQRIVEDALEICPQEKCSAQCKKLISPTHFRLKGNGWTPKSDSFYASAMPKSMDGTKGRG